MQKIYTINRSHRYETYHEFVIEHIVAKETDCKFITTCNRRISKFDRFFNECQQGISYFLTADDAFDVLIAEAKDLVKGLEIEKATYIDPVEVA